MPIVYLIHFDMPLGNERHKAQHYIGYTGRESLTERMAKHASGNGAAIMRAVQERGIEWHVVRTWSNGTRGLERKLKCYHKARQLCPICSPNNHSGYAVLVS